MFELRFISMRHGIDESACKQGTSDRSVSALSDMSIDSIRGRSANDSARMLATLSPIDKWESFRWEFLWRRITCYIGGAGCGVWGVTWDRIMKGK